MNKMSIITIVGVVLIFLGGIGGILLSVGQFRSSKNDKNEIIENTKNENDFLKTELNEIKKERADLMELLVERDKKIDAQTIEIISLNKRLIEKSEYIENYLSGGESYPVIELRKSDNDQGFYFWIMNNFDVPINNVDVQIFDYDLLKSFKGNSNSMQMSDYLKSIIYNEYYNVLPPKEYRSTPKIFSLKSARLYAKIHTTNRTVIQVLVIHQNITINVGFQVFDTDGNMLQEMFYEPCSSEVKRIMKKDFLEIYHGHEFKFSN